MLKITHDAKAAIQELLVANDRQNGGLRISVQAGGCAGLQYGMKLEESPNEDDIVLQADWGAIYIEPESAAKLDGTTVDFTETVAGKGFNFENPNAEGKCSCGKSFA
jgi:iron-sulfur cluster assembly protein